MWAITSTWFFIYSGILGRWGAVSKNGFCRKFIQLHQHNLFQNTIGLRHYRPLDKRSCVWLKFSGGQGWWDLQNPPPPCEQLLPLPTPCFKMFWKDPLTTPTPTSSIFHCYPLPIHHPFPLKILIIHLSALSLKLALFFKAFLTIFEFDWICQLKYMKSDRKVGLESQID